MDTHMLLNTEKQTYFGVNIYRYSNMTGVIESEIKKLPFFQFWRDSSLGSTCILFENGNDKDTFVYLQDWVNFCKMFIETGKHRYMD